MKITSSLKSELKKFLSRQPVLLAYIFGSYVQGHATKKSDLDIALLLPENLSKKERFVLRLKLIGELSRLSKKEIDLVILNDLASVFFKYVIVSEGKLLYKKTEAQQIDFESAAFSVYFDFQPFLDLYNKHYVQNNL